MDRDNPLINAGLKGWYNRHEAKLYLEDKVESKLEEQTILHAAMGALSEAELNKKKPKIQLYLNIVEGTKDTRERVLDAGLWTLVVKPPKGASARDKGKPARQQISHYLSSTAPIIGVGGAFIERDGVVDSPRELVPHGWPGSTSCAWPQACELAFVEEDLNRLAQTIMKQVPKQEPVAPASDSKPEKSGEDESLATKERNNLLTIIAALAKHPHALDLGESAAADRLEGIVKELKRDDGKTGALSERSLRDTIREIDDLSDLRAWKNPPWKNRPKRHSK
tara:strand:- start:2783 stop:3622 length:840 start_codon:yes stop_codon:yes gene_type:complete